MSDMNCHLLEQWGLMVADVFLLNEEHMILYGDKIVRGEGKLTTREYQSIEEAMEAMRRDSPLAAKCVLYVYTGLNLHECSKITGYTRRSCYNALQQGEAFVKGYLYAIGVL